MLGKFQLLSLPWRIGIWAGGIALAVTIVGGAYLGWRTHQRNIGWNSAIETIAEQNAVAKREADKAKGLVRECRDRGGAWNISTGECDE